MNQLSEKQFDRVLSRFEAKVAQYNIDIVQLHMEIEDGLFIAGWTRNDLILAVAGTSDLMYRMVNKQDEIIAEGNINTDYDFLDLYRRLFE